MSMLCPNAYGSRRAPETAGLALDDVFATLEAPIAALGAALRERDAAALEAHAAALHEALAAALPRLAATPASAIPAPLRQRLASIGARVGAQREAVARDNAAIERALSVLMPTASPAAVYGTRGQSERAPTSGCLSA